jgi:hypothetical protein
MNSPRIGLRYRCEQQDYRRKLLIEVVSCSSLRVSLMPLSFDHARALRNGDGAGTVANRVPLRRQATRGLL